MRTINSSIKKSICYMLSLAMFLFASIGLIAIFDNEYVSYASSSNIKEIELNNPNFVPSGSQSSYPIDPSNYTLIGADFEEVEDSESVNATNIGTIKRDEEDFKNLYPYSNPNNTNEEYMLVIDSKSRANVGYIMDSAISMSADSNYMITVDVYTNASGIAELYLVDSNNDNEIVSSILFAGKANNWTTYTFVVKTNYNSSTNIKLAMFHNGAGAVLFDNISAYQLNDSALTSVSSDATIIDLNDQTLTRYDMTSSNSYIFREGPSNVEDSTYSYVTTNDEESFDGTNNFAFRAENINTTTSLYTTKNDFLTLEQNRVYKISVKAKTIDLDGEITLSLIATDSNGDIASDDLADENPTITISTNTSSELTNDYTDFNFYIVSNPIQSANYRFAINFGGEDGAKGKLYLSTITISFVDYSTYSNASGSNIATANLSSKFAITEDDVTEENNYYLLNGNFNSVEVEDYLNAYPITPSGWTVETGSYDQKYGVVNTDNAEWNKWANNSNCTNLINPNSPSANSNNNILMMYNSTNDVLSYTSSAISLEKESNYRFTLNIKTQNAPATISLITTLDKKEVVLSTLTINTNFEWKVAELKLNTAYQALDVSLKVTLNTSNGYGYTYIDEACINLSSINEKADYSTSADLNNLFANNGQGNFATPDYISGESNDSVTYGIVNTSNINDNTIISNNDKEQRASFLMIGDNKNILAIRSLENVYYTLSSDLGYDLTSGNYYSISIKVFTYNHLAVSGEELDNLNASISISGFNGSFTNIITANLNSDNSISNGWKTYTFYINPTSDITGATIQFSLGSASNECSGTVFFTDIEFNDDLTSFDSVSENEFNKILEQSTSTNEDDSTSSDTDTENETYPINWGYILPTILFSLAIVIAVVGVCVRKIKWKKPTKKSKNEYDRNQTVSKQVYMRKATSIKESKIKELSKELDSLFAQRNEYESQYKKDLSSLREMKIKRADKSDINKLEKEMKKNQRLSANIGINITKIQNELSYVKSDAYMNNLIKKLASEKTKTAEQSDSSQTDKSNDSDNKQK